MDKRPGRPSGVRDEGDDMPELKRYGFQAETEEIEVEMDGPVIGYASQLTSPDETMLDRARAESHRALSILLIVVALCLIAWTVKSCL